MFCLALAVVITVVSNCFIPLTDQGVCTITIAAARTLVLLRCIVLSIKEEKCVLCAILIPDAPGVTQLKGFARA